MENNNTNAHRVSNKLDPSLFSRQNVNRISAIPLNEIRPNPEQPRRFFDQASLVDLAESIAGRGQLQPGIVRRDPVDDQYTLVAGERRWRAMNMLNEQGRLKKPFYEAIVISGDADEDEEIALVENMQRDGLRPLEEAEGIQRLIDKHKYTQDQAGAAIGKKHATVTQILSLTRLPTEIKDACNKGDPASKSFLIELAQMGSDDDRLSAWRRYRSGEMKPTVRAVRAVRAGEPGTTPSHSAFNKATRALYAAATTLKGAKGEPSEAERIALRKAHNEFKVTLRKIDAQPDGGEESAVVYE